MSKKVYVFPGQGSQYAGMLEDIATLSEGQDVEKTFSKLLDDEFTDTLLSDLENNLEKTKYSQPVIFIHSCMAFREAVKLGRPDFLAGHSLGEFTATACSGAMSFENALGLVKKRAEIMEEVAQKSKGAMTAVIGLSDDEATEAVKGLKVYPANYNSDGQIVISGEKDELAKAEQLLMERGARRVIRLKVGGAFHSPLIKSAAEKFKKILKDTDFNSPSYPVIFSYGLRVAKTAEDVRVCLLEQMESPVYWKQIVKKAGLKGCGLFIELGPGKVLSRLIERILPTVTVASARNHKEIQAIGGILQDGK